VLQQDTNILEGLAASIIRVKSLHPAVLHAVTTQKTLTWIRSNSCLICSSVVSLANFENVNFVCPTCASGNGHSCLNAVQYTLTLIMGT
jgi:hypothetical protein